MLIICPIVYSGDLLVSVPSLISSYRLSQTSKNGHIINLFHFTDINFPFRVSFFFPFSFLPQDHKYVNNYALVII